MTPLKLFTSRTPFVTALAVVALVCGTVQLRADPPFPPPDILILHAHLYGALNHNSDAIAITGNRISAVGASEELEKLAGPGTLRIDALRHSVTPGFNDAHVHFLSGSIGLSQIDLAETQSIEEVEQRVRTFVKSHPDLPFYVGRGWVYGTFVGGLPDRQLLDQWIADRPAVMKCYDGHTLWLNSAALRKANITRETPDPADGIIVRDPASGEPTGVLKEGAIELAKAIMPEPSGDEKLASLRQGIQAAHRYGVTSVQEAGVDAEELALFDQLRRDGQLPLRMMFAVSGEPRMTEEELLKRRSWRRQFSNLNVRAVKLYVDGVIEAHTAAMLAPYANNPSRGLPNFTQDDLNRTVQRLDADGWQILVHAIGDGGIRMTFDAFEHARAINGASDRPRRHRLEHIETISLSDLARFAELGVVASMQPYHANPNGNIFQVWAANLGPERAARAWAWKSIQDAGGRLAFGSDWPVVSLDPRLGMHTALTRQTLSGEPTSGFIPEQRLPLAAVIDAYTRDAAFAEFAEDQKGSLRVGMLADVLIWDHDLDKLPVADVHTASVVTTLFDGSIVFPADPPRF